MLGKSSSGCATNSFNANKSMFGAQTGAIVMNMQLIKSALGVFSSCDAPRSGQSSSFPSLRAMLWTVLVWGFLFCGIERSPAQVLVQIGQNFTGSTYGSQ